MALYSKIKSIIKQLNNTYLGIIILFVPLFIYFFLKNLIKQTPEFCYSYYYYHTSKIIKNNDLTIGIKSVGIKKTIFPHPVGIVIGKHVQMGNHCTIYQNVTIGARTIKEAEEKKYPTIGNNVTICTGSIVIGKITIGNNVIIGANTLINKDIPGNVIVYGNPMRIRYINQ